MKYLEKLLERFRVKAKQIKEWHKSKQEGELNEDVSKLTSIPTVQNKVKGMESFDEEFEGQKKSTVENQKIGEEIVNGGHESMEEVKNSMQTCSEKNQ